MPEMVDNPEYKRWLASDQEGPVPPLQITKELYDKWYKQPHYELIADAEGFFAEDARPERSEPFYIGPETYDSLQRCCVIARRAITYVDIRNNHQQIAGEAWLDLVAAIEGDTQP